MLRHIQVSRHPMVGTKLSHYHIVDELGRGGMGIVYKARDSKLDRTVAIKVLPSAALASKDDRARFYREAKAAAQLHHPNIASIFEIDEAVPEGAGSDDLRPFIAMEYVDGESVEDRIKAGPLKLDEAVEIVMQIALALEAAHEKNIVHRDIKSANVMMTSKGVAKVLDFGLAKTIHSTMLTQLGSTVGTFAYMSPEQTRGEEVDHRSDLWALGVILYEATSGRLPFRGDYEQAVTYSILNEEPDPLTAVRTGVPMSLDWIVAKLLAKQPDNRYQSAKDLIVDLRTIDLSNTGMSRASGQAGATAPPPPVAHPTQTMALSSTPTRRIPGVVWALAGALLVALTAFLWPRPDVETAPATPKRITQAIPSAGSVSVVDISPSGDRVAFASDVVRVLDLKTGHTRQYDIGGVFVYVDFSDDGSSLLITTAAGIERLDLESGASVNVIETREGGPRASWAGAEGIVYEEDQSVFHFSLVTSESRRIVTLDSLNGEYDLDYPAVMPDGKTLMATAEFRDMPSRIGFWDIETGANLGYINHPGYRVQLLDDNYLIFVSDGDAIALPFDIKTRTQTNPTILIDNNVNQDGLAVSNEGTLVHVGTRIGNTGSQSPVVPVIVELKETSANTVLGTNPFPSGYYRNADIHPGGQMAAVVIENPDDPVAPGVSARDIWILDFNNWTRRSITRTGTADYPVWNLRGDSILYIDTEGNDRLLMMSVEGGTGSRLLRQATVPAFADMAVSPDGKLAIMAEGLPATLDAQSLIRIWELSTSESTTTPRNVTEVNSPNGNPRQFDISPDGRYVAYEDQGAIFVQSLADLSATPFEIWENSHALPRWSPDGRKLYALRTSDSRAYSVDVSTDPSFTVTSTSRRQVGLNGTSSLLAVFPDGNRFLTAFRETVSGSAAEPDSLDQSIDLHFIINVLSDSEI